MAEDGEAVKENSGGGVRDVVGEGRGWSSFGEEVAVAIRARESKRFWFVHDYQNLFVIFLSMFADDFTALEHTHICIMNCEMTKKICIDYTIPNGVSDCLRIKTMLSELFLLRRDWFRVLLIVTVGLFVLSSSSSS